MGIVPKSFEDKQVSFEKREDGVVYLNATETAKAFNKEARRWLELKETKEYINSLTKFNDGLNGIKNDLIISKKGKDGGIWLHPKLTVYFSRWLSADFAVWCDMQIEELLKNQASQLQLANQDMAKYLISENIRLQKELQEAKTPKTYKVVSELQKLQMKQMIQEGKSIPQIEREMDLTRNQIISNLEKMGLYTPTLETDKMITVINNHYHYYSS